MNVRFVSLVALWAATLISVNKPEEIVLPSTHPEQFPSAVTENKI